MTKGTQTLFKNKNTSLLIALLVMLLWGSLFPVIKIGYREFGLDSSSPGSLLLFAGLRFLICGLVFQAVLLRRDRKIRLPEKGSWLSIALITLSVYVLHYICLYIGISHLESSKTAILKQIGTLFIICFAFLFRKEDRFTAAKLIGGLLGFASILVINLNGFSLTWSGYDLLIIAASFFGSASIVISKNAYDRYDPLYVTGWAQLLGGAVLTVTGLMLGGALNRFTWSAAGTLVYICFASSTAYALWNVLLKYNDMSRLNVIKFAETLFSAVCSWILLGENIFRWVYLVSFLLVCFGILIGTGRIRKKQPE